MPKSQPDLSLKGEVSCKDRGMCISWKITSLVQSKKWSYQQDVLLLMSWFLWSQRVSFDTWLIAQVQIVLTGAVESTGSFPDTSGSLWIRFELRSANALHLVEPRLTLLMCHGWSSGSTWCQANALSLTGLICVAINGRKSGKCIFVWLTTEKQTEIYIICYMLSVTNKGLSKRRCIQKKCWVGWVPVKRPNGLPKNMLSIIHRTKIQPKKICFLTPWIFTSFCSQMGVFGNRYSVWIHMVPKGYVNSMAYVTALEWSIPKMLRKWQFVFKCILW